MSFAVGPIIEVILYVQDMGAQVAFYRDVMGLTPTTPPGPEGYAGAMWVTFRTGECTLALHGGGKGRTGEDSPKLVFRVEEVPSAREALLRHGVLMGKVRTAAPGILVCDGKDPEGNAFSIESRPDH